MKWILTVLAVIFKRLAFSLHIYNSSFYQAGWAISFGLYYQFENVLSSDVLLLRFISITSLCSALFLLPNISNSAVQSLEILFILSSLLLILHHSFKVIVNPSMKSCWLMFNLQRRYQLVVEKLITGGNFCVQN